MWSATKRVTLSVGVISAVTFVGTGTEDLTVTGRPEFAASRSYKVVIDSASETFKWSNDNGATFEETSRKILANQPYELINAEGEKEGIFVTFGSAAGHVNTDAFSWTTTGTVVANSDTALNATVPVINATADGMILFGRYVKGAEDGLQLYVAVLAEKPNTVEHRLSRPLDLGDGGLRHKAEYFELDATANYTYRVNLKGVGKFKVYQVRKGAVGGTGLFTCFADLYQDRT